MSVMKMKQMLVAMMLVPVFAMASAFAKATADKVGQWEVFEMSFASSKSYDNPFIDVEVDVLFSNGKEKWKVPAFWDGGRTWKVRFSAREKGTYSYRAIATDQSDTGLNTKEKTLTVTEYKGENPLYRHGPIHIATDNRHFAYADGTPFFWLGDTFQPGTFCHQFHPGKFCVCYKKESGIVYSCWSIVVS